MKEPFKALFDELHEAEEEIETAIEAVAVAEINSRKVRSALWAAIDHAIAARADQEDLRDAIARLETMVLELTTRLPPTG